METVYARLRIIYFYNEVDTTVSKLDALERPMFLRRICLFYRQISNHPQEQLYSYIKSVFQERSTIALVTDGNVPGKALGLSGNK